MNLGLISKGCSCTAVMEEIPLCDVGASVALSIVAGKAPGNRGWMGRNEQTMESKSLPCGKHIGGRGNR